MEEVLSLEDILKEQVETGVWISRMWDKILSLDKAKINNFILEARLERLDNYWDTFLKNHRTIMRDPKASETDYVKNSMFDDIEEKYFDNKALISQEIAKVKSASASVMQPSEKIKIEDEEEKLPKIPDLPTFSGNILEWENFKQKFESLVDDSDSLTEVQKFTYLKQHLFGEPAQILRDIPTNESNYKESWEKLVKKYGNSRILSYTLMLILYNIKPAEKRAASELDRLLKAFELPYTQLKAMGKPMDTWDEWFAFLMCQKLDQSTRMDWVTHLVDREDIPKFSELCDFIKCCKNLRPVMENNNSNHSNAQNNKYLQPNNHKCKSTLNQSKRNQSQHHQNVQRSSKSIADDSVSDDAKISCLLCSGPHVLNYCHKFRQMDPKLRQEMAKKMNLCSNCLAFGHQPLHCPSKATCLVCSKKHHSMLHSM